MPSWVRQAAASRASVEGGGRAAADVLLDMDLESLLQQLITQRQLVKEERKAKKEKKDEKRRRKEGKHKKEKKAKKSKKNKKDR